MTRVLVTGFEPFVPLLPEQALDRNAPSMPLEALVRGVRVVISAAV